MTVTVKGAAASAQQLATIRSALTEAHSLGAGERTLIACVMCMTQESSCLPINYGDRDSLGPYQQRTPWGPASVREDPAGSTRLFLFGGETGEPGWRAYWSVADGSPSDVPLTLAINRVQVSAFPYAYGAWQAEATATVAWWLSTITPPPSMHYDWYPARWQKGVRRYDTLRELEHTGHLTRQERPWLAGRRTQCRGRASYIWAKAHLIRKNGKPSWSEEHRGWLFQQLLHRGQGKRVLPS